VLQSSCALSLRALRFECARAAGDLPLFPLLTLDAFIDNSFACRACRGTQPTHACTLRTRE
jgi:hypothetical protein